MRALSIRQPYAELILRGIKTVEYRTRPTRIVGERFYVYASKGKAKRMPVWSRDLAMPGEARLGLAPPRWMLELAEQIRMFERQRPADAALPPTGLIVGTAVIERVVEGGDGFFHWHLTDVERVDRLRKPTGHPQPVWFNPF